MGFIIPGEMTFNKMEEKERVVLVQRKWSNNLFFLILSTSLHTLVNKVMCAVNIWRFSRLVLMVYELFKHMYRCTVKCKCCPCVP